ncbi:MAG: alpha-L-fucosidase [Candidatus Omnitrophica bacterium]|nr:alpha-L-fucosidase [Candidatus Omnitrophota bacterium]
MENKDRVKWFEEARFGMFIHWGDYSVLGRGEWVMFQENIPVSEYEKLADKFKPPKSFSPLEWVKLAKEAGMNYMVLTTRHHDGFCLFDSNVTDFTSVKRAAGRDFIREYVDACRKEGMRIGFYYSLIDWRMPVAYEGPEKNSSEWKRYVAEVVHRQVEELMTNYGKIDILWYDGCFYINNRKTVITTAEHWESEKLNAMVRKLQPEIIINNRSVLPEDFDTPEQHFTPSPPGRMWESCMTMNKHWGYFATDDLYKSTKELVHILTACASGGGNLLLNVGPKPDGTIPKEAVVRLKKIGKWLKINGESIYGTKRLSLNTGTLGCATERENCYYIFVHWWPGRTGVLPYIKEEISSAYILSTGKKVNLKREGDRLIFTNLPEDPPDELTTVIVLKKKEQNCGA